MRYCEFRDTIRRTCVWSSIGVVIGTSLVSCIVLGATLCSLSTLLVYIAAALHASVADTARTSGGFVFAVTVATPLVGWCCGRINPALLMIFGALLAGASYALASSAQSIHTFSLALVPCGIGVAAATYVPATLLISRRVQHRRGLAFACLLGASALGAVIFPPLANYLSGEFGWSGALRWLGGTIILLCVPILAAVGLLRLPNGSPGRSTDAGSSVRSGREAIVNGAFVRLTVLQMLAGLSYMGVYFFIVPYLIDAGYGADSARLECHCKIRICS